MMNHFIYIAICSLGFAIVGGITYGPHSYISNTVCKTYFDQYRDAKDEVEPEKDLAVICYGPNIKNISFPMTSNISQTIMDGNIFDPKLKLYIFICDMYDNPKSGYTKLMIDALEATTGPHNYIILDYSHISQKTYLDAFRTMYLSSQMGDLMANLLGNLYAKNVANPSQMHIIGTSVGGQIAGRVGRQFFNLTGTKISKITGLDVAGPCFDYTNEFLNQNDAEYLEMIHTQIGLLGSVKEVGHISYLPNGGGVNQPGCKLLTSCSHSRAIELYIQNLWNDEEPFYARKCNSWLNFILGLCNNNDLTVMTSNDTTKRGIYYLKTTGEKPFTLGLSGASSNGLFG